MSVNDLTSTPITKIAGEIPWPITADSVKVLAPLAVATVRAYKWMVIVGGILAFMMAWGIGANDVANAFATSVGAGSLSLKWACVIAAVMEFLGAILMGAEVTDTVRKKILNVDLFNPQIKEGAANGAEILMIGFLVALFCASAWLFVATYFGLPVSTTHSIIGSLIGVGLAYRGTDAIVWLSDGSGFDRLKGVVGVIISWVISPVLSGIFAIIIFLLVRHTVLRRKNPVRNGFLFLPFFYALTIAVTLFFIIYKGSPRFNLDEKFSVGEAIGIAVGGGVGVALLAWWFIIPQAKRFVDRWEKREMQKLGDPENYKAEVKSTRVTDALKKVGVNLDLNRDLDDDTIAMHDNVEKFDPKAEQLFTWLQIFTAAFDSFAHGANDVANAIAPFTSIFQLYRNGGQISAGKTNEFETDGEFQGGERNGDKFEEGDAIPDHEAFCGEKGDEKYFRCKDEGDVAFPYLQPNLEGASDAEFDTYDEEGKKVGNTLSTCYTACNPGSFVDVKSKKQTVPLWILAMGGVGIVLGLAMWGYRIIVAIGLKLTKLTPSRGFSIEVGAALTVIIASRIGLPVSTTHCQVGSTMGVGLVELKGGTVNWKQFFYICLAWVFTVVFTGLLAAGLFAFVTLSPYKFASPDHLVFCPANRLFVYDEAEQGFRGVTCSDPTFGS